MGDPSHCLSFFRGATAALLLGMFGFTAPVLAAERQAAEDSQADAAHPDAELPSAPVEIDGTVLFHVRGTMAFPAEKRAEAIAGRIEALAVDVEAMLLIAAERTPWLMKEPPPFVRQQALGDFAVTYELNVYCDDAQAMIALYTELHRNILDVFNEYGVQIMTPAYESDPELSKVVPKEQWFNAPAKRGSDGA